ncbi:Cdc6/Cdc18 family protein [Pyrococcus kukulkanii]|uniref:ORC1-type DNA replication protein n=1 Tax=Pyrococcus kukulkanii TaxID=1609559 RepID=A0ABV4T632_9EURY
MQSIRDEFEKFLQKGLILVNPHVLDEDYIPDKLLFRDEEIRRIVQYFARFLKGLSPGNLLIYGPPGVGKTHAILLVMKEFNRLVEEKGVDVRAVYVNCRDQSAAGALSSLAEILGLGTLSKNAGVNYIVSKIVKLLKEESTRYVFVFDEIDRMISTIRGRDPVENLLSVTTRLDEKVGRKVVDIVVVANTTNILNRLSASTRSKFVPETLYFRNYNLEELVKILEDRIEKAFVKGSVSPGVPRLIAAYILRGSRDLRWGLRVLKQAGIMADDKVDEELVRKAAEIVDTDLLRETIHSLSPDEFSLLFAITLVNVKGLDPTTSTVYTAYREVCDVFGYTPTSMKHLMYYVLPRLEATGLVVVSTKSLSGGKGKLLQINITESPKEFLGLLIKILEESGERVPQEIKALVGG